MEGRISRQLLAKALNVDFEQDMKIQVLDMTQCLCASGSGSYTTTRTDGQRQALQLFTTFVVITALKYNKHPSMDIFWCTQYLHTVSYSRHFCYACNFLFKFVT